MKSIRQIAERTIAERTTDSNLNFGVWDGPQVQDVVEVALLAWHKELLASLRLVTIKLPRNPDHDPHNKVTGTCPAGICTDATGEHHTLVALGDEDVEELRALYGHITRIEYI